MRRHLFACFSWALVAGSLAIPANASLITNGSFDTVGSGITNSFEVTAGSTTQLPGWVSTAGISCVVFPGTATTNTCGGTVGNLWAGTGSPDGGNFFLMDGDSHNNGLLSQTLTGLIPGQFYSVSFFQAGGQLAFFSGNTFENWTVSLGSESHDSSLLSTPSHGFTGWVNQTLIFKATSPTELLAFFAVGTPNGEPPMIALDSVSVTQTPEPGTAALFSIAAAIGMLAIRRWRRKTVTR